MNLSEIYKTDHGDLSRLDILLLEEEAGEAGRFGKLITECSPGYHVSYAGNLDDALDILYKGCIDMLIFDLSHAGSDSLEALIEPALDLNKPYAIIALVDEKDEPLGADAAKRGAEDYLIKGDMNTKLLEKSIRQSIRCHHLRHRNINLVLVDSLTGLLARKGFMMMAEQELKVARRYRKETFLLFLRAADLERRKERMGMVKFEKVVREISSVFRHTFRGADIVSSFGDGLFAGLAVGATPESSAVIHSRLNEGLMKLKRENTLGMDLLFDTGMVMFDPEYPQSIEEMIEEAGAMFKKRSNGDA